jgi:hypothetical protein
MQVTPSPLPGTNAPTSAAYDQNDDDTLEPVKLLLQRTGFHAYLFDSQVLLVSKVLNSKMIYYAHKPINL